MRTRNPRSRLSRLAVAAALTLGGCAASTYPPAIPPGSVCALCSMTIEDAHFACEQNSNGAWRAYDSIECLLRETAPEHDVFLADYDAMSLHPADSMWVVRGRIDSPMGGGLAAFRTRRQAEEVAGATAGEVLRWNMLLAHAEGAAP